MNAGYVRLSKDDDKRNYVSIENQKLIISQYAKSMQQHIDRWYEDDGVSGYRFDRPGFQRLMEDLDKDIDVVFVKDFSRLGRHNAKVLLLLDDFQERDKRLIVIDDHYDSVGTEDDTIGIKTWYNERYVKDTSRKIKCALHARQKEGTLLTHPPFGYRRHKQDPMQLEITPQEADCIRQIFSLYQEGAGYRRIAIWLNETGIPTPSMFRRKQELADGKVSRRQIATKWSESMVRDILGNDFYTGTLRLHKRTRTTVHGKDRRVPSKDQYLFADHHPAIIGQEAFSHVQMLKEKRCRTHYRGAKNPWTSAGFQDPFSGLLFCKDCQSRLTPIRRHTSTGEHTYYICSAYNTKGPRCCAKSHLIRKEDLAADIYGYLDLCLKTLKDSLLALKPWDNTQKPEPEDKQTWLRQILRDRKQEMETLLRQKIQDLSAHPEQSEIIGETYRSLQQQLLSQIQRLQSQIQELQSHPIQSPHSRLQKPVSFPTLDLKETLPSALQILERALEKRAFTNKDLKLLLERIDVDADGSPRITLKFPLPLISADFSREMNGSWHRTLAQSIRCIMEEGGDFTSAKSLSRMLTKRGYPATPGSILPYIRLLTHMEILSPPTTPRKPYAILKTSEELEEILQKFCDLPSSIIL